MDDSDGVASAMSSYQQGQPTLLDFRPLILTTEKFELLWERYQQVPMAFRPEWFDKRNFLNYFNNNSSLFFEIGDCEGLASAVAIIPGMSAVVDFVMFDKTLRGREYTFHAIIKQFFLATKAVRLTGLVPASKNVSQRLLTRLGFRREGRMRNAHKSQKGYEDILILGLLKGSVDSWPGPGFINAEANVSVGSPVLQREAVIGEVYPGDMGDNVVAVPTEGSGGSDSTKEE